MRDVDAESRTVLAVRRGEALGELSDLVGRRRKAGKPAAIKASWLERGRRGDARYVVVLLGRGDRAKESRRRRGRVNVCFSKPSGPRASEGFS
jgi:hypothetical protein